MSPKTGIRYALTGKAEPGWGQRAVSAVRWPTHGERAADLVITIARGSR